MGFSANGLKNCFCFNNFILFYPHTHILYIYFIKSIRFGKKIFQTNLKRVPNDGIFFSSFNKFSKTVQEELLERGTPNHIQLMIIFYTTTFIGRLRLREILKLEANESTNSLVELNKISNIFKPTADVGFLCQLLTKFDFLKFEDVECRAILTFIILFDQELLERLEVESNDGSIINVALFDRCRRTTIGRDVVSLKHFLSMVVTMSVFFASNVDWSQITFPQNSVQSGIQNFNLVMGYTKEEESWLNEKFQKLEEAYRSG